MARPHPETISPTAEYTGYIWFAHGHSHEAFATRRGRWLYRVLRAPNAAAHAIGLPTLEGMLLARHRLIDLRLAQAIDAGEVSQVIEVAAGLSPRGWRFCERYGQRITYVEADLPDMVRRKREVLAHLCGETAHHRIVEVNALAEDGPTSIAAVCAGLDPSRGIALVTEGLLNYFDRAVVTAMWARFARALARFPRAIYLSDLVVQEGSRGLLVATFTTLLGAFVRGRVHVDFTGAADVEAALEAAGFDGIVHHPRDFAFELPGLEVAGAGVVRVIEAMLKG
jgi:O-methyltransferase involved in polyketide biosynthesis